ncbi:MAG: sigma-54-dependent Fis family transcriptional regulator [Rhodobacter sp.]|nr:sigma-54-dependent Fis family transcriptional regulator [Rhodobacter sp.]MBS3980121.1 sigma-54-dependent Fis family transcriptional regulator [Paracoccaceae bacterium]
MKSSTPLSRPAVLLVEDTLSLQMVYRSILATSGHRVAVAATAAEGLDQFRTHRPMVVLLDLMLPDRDGLEVMQEIQAIQPETRVIAITANGSVNRAVEAMRAGAHDFLVKPFDEGRLLSAVQNALAEAGPRDAVKPADPTASPTRIRDASQIAEGSGFIGSSEAMKRIHATISSVARSMATVFITGESGTGKELCALAVHANSARADGPFIALNCGAIPQDLLESEVFGHVKGSFTGAISDKQGAAAAADGGTLFLDEICEMAPALQTKLLRFLQTSTVQPVGATRPRKVNVRIVCATNRDPLDAVRRGHFREDLYYRLYVVPIHMPPLRDRGLDILEISEAALSRFAQEEGREFHGLDPVVRNLLLSLPWPGNVRQLLNVMRNVVVLNPGGWVTADMLPPGLADESRPVEPQPLALAAPDAVALDSLVGLPLAEAERRLIEATLALHGGSIPKAARVLDVSPSTLYRKIEAWNTRAS